MFSYEDSNSCPDNEAFMACPADAGMTAVAETHGIFAGAPPPLECFPKMTNAVESSATGAWDPTLSCEEYGCSSYEGQTRGNIDPESVPTKNSVSAALCCNKCLFNLCLLVHCHLLIRILFRSLVGIM